MGTRVKRSATKHHQKNEEGRKAMPQDASQMIPPLLKFVNLIIKGHGDGARDYDNFVKKALSLIDTIKKNNTNIDKELKKLSLQFAENFQNSEERSSMLSPSVERIVSFKNLINGPMMMATWLKSLAGLDVETHYYTPAAEVSDAPCLLTLCKSYPHIYSKLITNLGLRESAEESVVKGYYDDLSSKFSLVGFLISAHEKNMPNKLVKETFEALKGHFLTDNIQEIAIQLLKSDNFTLNPEHFIDLVLMLGTGEQEINEILMVAHDYHHDQVVYAFAQRDYSIDLTIVNDDESRINLCFDLYKKAVDDNHKNHLKILKKACSQYDADAVAKANVYKDTATNAPELKDILKSKDISMKSFSDLEKQKPVVFDVIDEICKLESHSTAKDHNVAHKLIDLIKTTQEDDLTIEYEGLNALQYAAQKGDATVVSNFLQNDLWKETVNAKTDDSSLKTAAHLAIENNHMDVLQQLISSDILDMNSVDGGGNTLLCAAIQSAVNQGDKNIDIAIRLINKGAEKAQECSFKTSDVEKAHEVVALIEGNLPGYISRNLDIDIIDTEIS